MRRARRWLAFGATAALWAPALVTGCDDPPLECEDYLLREVPPFVGAAGALAETTFDLRADVAFACASLAGALGVEDPPIVTDPASVSDEHIIEACGLARAALEEALSSVGPLSVSLAQSACDYAALAQITCEIQCSAFACDAGTVEERCELALTKGTCEADCTGTCVMQSGSVPCAGSCEGTCQGDCSGACGADCVGPCDGVCTGLCFGACEDVQPGATCAGACKGGCSTAYVEPVCQGPIAETTCDITPVCAEVCEAHALLGSSCDRATLVVEGDDSMKAILEAHATPIFVAAKLWGAAAVERAELVAEQGYFRANEAVYQAGCVYALGVQLLPTFDTARENLVSMRLLVDESARIVALIEAAE